MISSSLSRGQLVAMAVITGTTIANVYHAQPILAQIGASFGTAAAAVGNLPALTQVGVGSGCCSSRRSATCSIASGS